MPYRTWLHRGRRTLAVLLALALLLTALPGFAQGDDGEDVVSRVNDDLITRDDFHARVRFVRWQYLNELTKLHELTAGNPQLRRDYVLSLLDTLNSPDALGDNVLAQMEEERLLAQAAADQGIAVSDEDVRVWREQFFSLWTGVEPDELADNEQAQAFITAWYDEATTTGGMDQDAIAAIFGHEALYDALQDHIGANLPTEELAVNSRHILCSFQPLDPTLPRLPDDEARAAAEACIADAQARLVAGDDFASVAADLSDDPTSAAEGGELGWVSTAYLLDGYATAATDAALNTVVGPVETELGLHLIEVMERRMQALSEDELAADRQNLFDVWLDSLYTDATIERSDDWDVGIPTEPTLDSLSAEVRGALDALR